MIKKLLKLLLIFSCIYSYANINEQIDQETSIFKNENEIQEITKIKVRDINELKNKEIDFDTILDELEQNLEESVDNENKQ